MRHASNSAGIDACKINTRERCRYRLLVPFSHEPLVPSLAIGASSTQAPRLRR
jgi:hypothetical protein